MDKIFQSLLIIFSLFIHCISLNTPLILGDYKLKIYEHPKCEILYCSQILFKDDFWNYISCQLGASNWESAKDKFGLTEDEAVSLCMPTYSAFARDITNILSKGDQGIFGCFLDHYNEALNKVLLYAKNNNMSTFDSLFHGISLEDAKSMKIIDGDKCLLTKGTIFYFSAYGSTSVDKKVARSFAVDQNQNKKGGIIINIKTLGKETKAVMVENFSSAVQKQEAEYVYPPYSKFEVISDCNRTFLENGKILYEVVVKEIKEYLEYETQTRDPNEDIINKYTLQCTRCNENVHNNCKYCENSDRCSECYSGYIPNSKGQCIKCKSNCLKCIDENNLDKCIQCFNGFGLIESKCNSCKDNNCKNCDNNLNECNECKKGYILANKKCVEESEPWCKKYNLNGECEECFGGAYLKNSKCIDCQDKNCVKCKEENGNEICIECVPGFGLDNGICKKCDIWGCLKCKDNKCITCDNYFALKSDGTCTRCYNIELGYCKKCKYENENLKCEKCYKGFLLENNYCKRCYDAESSYCIECKEKIDTCTSCLPSKILNNSDLCEDCGFGCSECQYNQGKKECLFCKNSFYMDTNKECKQCPDGCEKCITSETCDQCIIEKYVMNSEGLCEKCDNLIEGCEKCDKTENNEIICTQCEIGYSLKNGKCEKCKSLIDNCAFCEINDKGKPTCLNCLNKNKIFMFGFEQYGIKDGKCLECNSKNCGECILNADNVPECTNKNSNGGNKLTIIMLKIIIIFLFI